MTNGFICPDCGRTSNSGLQFEEVQFAVGSTCFVCEDCIQSDQYATVEPPFMPCPIVVVRDWCKVTGVKPRCALMGERTGTDVSPHR